MKTSIQRKIAPRHSWNSLDDHYLSALTDPWYHELAEIQNMLSVFTTQFYQSKNIKTLFLPITTGSISSPMGLGSDSSPVKVNLCGVDTYLADSMQFMLEYGCRIFNNGCYYIMPSFRGEKADERHLCQFYHSEAEIPGTLDDIINLVEKYLAFLSEKFLSNYGENLLQIAGNLDHIQRMKKCVGNIPRVTLARAVEILKNDPAYVTTHELGFKIINSAGEKALISIYNGPVWLTNFDAISVPFYQATLNEDNSIAINADLLMGIGETVGSGERHFKGEDLLRSLKVHDLDVSPYRWYYNMKTKFPMKTSGFGMGTERFILWLCNLTDIRDCQLLPRFNGINIIP